MEDENIARKNENILHLIKKLGQLDQQISGDVDISTAQSGQDQTAI